ncbi:MAG: hypothetical protein IIC02_12250 [Planctomycetes bacterium]|nr:hypothetical protein [Planctomycetota bacterium]
MDGTSRFCANLNECDAGHYQTNTFLPTWSDEYFRKRIVDLVAADRLRDGDGLCHAYVRAKVSLTSGKHRSRGLGLRVLMKRVEKGPSAGRDSTPRHRPCIVREAILLAAPSEGPDLYQVRG